MALLFLEEESSWVMRCDLKREVPCRVAVEKSGCWSKKKVKKRKEENKNAINGFGL